ncbi:hypothetical protein [Bradyrhizobium genosp. SA-3]|nr:hypothetical protein [Bradyrhizobium genosp. SA-3]
MKIEEQTLRRLRPRGDPAGRASKRFADQIEQKLRVTMDANR